MRRAERGEGAYAAVALDHLPHVHGGELVQLLVGAGAKDDDGHVNRAEHRKLMGLLEQAAFPLQKGAGYEADG